MLLQRAFLRFKGLERRVRFRLRRAPRGAFAAPVLPRRVWLFWAQGFDQAPPLVRYCAEEWRRKNPGWEVSLLSAADIADFVSMADAPAPPAISYQAFADLLRIRLLDAHGGVWADATCLPLRPLDDWLAPLMQAGFFAFHRPAADRMISNWFQASVPSGRLIRTWERAAARYLAGVRKPDDYFWPHYLFEWLVRTDRAFREAWEQVPKVSAEGPHYLKRCLESTSPIEPRRLASFPLQKLDWRCDYGEENLRRWSRAVEDARASAD